MTGARSRLALLLAAPLLLSGCAAAVIPVVAAGTLVRKQTTSAAAPAVPAPTASTAEPRVTAPPDPIPAAAPAVSPDPQPDTGYGEYEDFTGFALKQAARVNAGESLFAVVLEAEATPDRPRYMPCGARGPAVIVDLDPADTGPDLGLPLRGAAPDYAVAAGLEASLSALRASGVQILWMTDLPVDHVMAIADRLKDNDLDPDARDVISAPLHGEDRKQLRRQRAALDHCIIAIAGDRKSDHDEAYDFLRGDTSTLTSSGLFGKGWFLTPLPLVRDEPPAAVTSPTP